MALLILQIIHQFCQKTKEKLELLHYFFCFCSCLIKLKSLGILHYKGFFFLTNHYFKKWTLLNNKNCSLGEYAVHGNVCSKCTLVTKRYPVGLVCLPDDWRWEPLANYLLAIWISSSENVYSSAMPIFKLNYLVFHYWVLWVPYVFWMLAPCQICAVRYRLPFRTLPFPSVNGPFFCAEGFWSYFCFCCLCFGRHTHKTIALFVEYKTIKLESKNRLAVGGVGGEGWRNGCNQWEGGSFQLWNN